MMVSIFRYLELDTDLCCSLCMMTSSSHALRTSSGSDTLSWTNQESVLSAVELWTNQSRVLGHLVRGRLRLRGVVVKDPWRRVRRVGVLVLGGRLLLRREVVLQTGLVKLCHFLQHKAPCRSLYDCFRCILIIRWPRLIFN